MRADLDDEILQRLIINSDAARRFDLLKNRIIESCRRHIPQKHISINNPSWINNYVKQSNARGQRAFYARKRNNTDEPSAEYFTARWRVKKSREASQTQQGNQCCKIMQNEPQGFYSYINEMRIIRGNVGLLKTPTGQIVTTNIDMASTLNTYFSSVFTHEQLNNISQLPIFVGNTLDTNRFIYFIYLFLFIFRPEDVQENLNPLNMYKSTGPDLLHPRVLRTLEDMLCGPLNHIFNKSADTGIIPEDWKSANVTAIHKKRQQTGT